MSMLFICVIALLFNIFSSTVHKFAGLYKNKIVPVGFMPFLQASFKTQ